MKTYHLIEIDHDNNTKLELDILEEGIRTIIENLPDFLIKMIEDELKEHRRKNLVELRKHLSLVE